MNLNFFYKAFPTPKFLDVPYAGLSISDDFIRCIKFVRANGGLQVEFFTEKKVPEGAIVSGVIKDSLAVSGILQDIKKEFKIDFVRVSMSEEDSYLFNTKIPKIDPKEIKDAIESKMEENVPVSSAELVFDYVITTPHGHEDHVDVVVSAFPIKIIDSYIEAFERAGLRLLSLEIESQAIVRSLLPKTNDGAHLIVHFNKQKVGLSVAFGGVVHFTSTIYLKNGTSDLQSLISEIKRLYIYWHTLRENAEDENKKIKQIVLSGDLANEENVSFISANTKSKVVLGDVWSNAFDINKKVPPVSYEKSLNFATAIGLALPEESLI